MMHLLKYQFLHTLKSKEMLFWCLAFPLIMATFFYMGFGRYMKEGEQMNQISAAIVETKVNQENQRFKQILKGIPGFHFKMESAKKAEGLLENEKVDGIIFLGTVPKLTVKSDGINQTILKEVLDEYIQMETLVKKTVKTHPQNISRVVQSMQNSGTVNENISLGSETANDNLQYFYALIAMTCLYGCFMGLYHISEIQANLTTLGARQSISPVHKMKIVGIQFLAGVTIQFCAVCITLCYLVKVLGISMGSHYKEILLTGFLGCFVGVSMGILIGAAGRWSLEMKNGLCVGISLFCSFLSGLMFSAMKNIIELHAPLINRINPAALITDSFYSLYIYQDHSRYMRNSISLVIIGGIFCLASYLIIRRRKYESI